MHTIKNIFNKIVTFDALMQAHRLARRNKRHYDTIINFEMNLNANIFKIKSELENKTYKMGEYHSFIVHEPKEREIMASEYKDRIVMHLICDNVLWPYIDNRLDYDNCACRVGKGTHFGLKRTATHLKRAFNKYGRDFYILKCDISKYFYSIRHDVLKKLLYRFISDKDVIWLLDIIIDSTPGNVGIPIGNLTSQFFATFYLDALDKFVRKELKIMYYNRYMDDFLLIHQDKNYLKECLERMRVFLSELGLSFNKKTQLFPARNGVDYLGFHTYITETGRVVRKLRRKSKAAMKRKIKAFNRKYRMGLVTFDKVRCCIASWSGHAKFGNTYFLRKKILSELSLNPPQGET